MPRLTVPEMTDNAVPVLAVDEDRMAFVEAAHAAALDPDDDTELLTGAVVYIDNPRPAGAPEAEAAYTMFQIGASTLHEAATEIIGAMPSHALDMPTWVTSTDPELAETLAEHYTVDRVENGKIKRRNTCEAIAMNEAPV